MTRMRTTLGLVGLLTLGSGALLAQRPDVNTRIRENQVRLDSIRRQRAQLQTDMERLEGRAHTLTSELHNIERQKTVTSRVVNELDRQIGGLSAEVDTATLDVMLAQDALAEKRAVLDTRLVEIYKRGRLWMFEVLLAAESFGDLIGRYKYLFLVSRQDRALTRSVEELRDRVAQQRGELVTVHTELERQREARGSELDRYLSLERRRQRALRTTQASRRTASSRLDSLTRDEERLTTIIANLDAERRRAGAAIPGTITDASLGTLPWPIDSRVIYSFGRQSGPDDTTLRQHGIGIAAPVGTDVRAVADGTAAHAGPFGTYGFMVMLDHGGNYYTLYLYLSAVAVSLGQYVQAGQVIGASGGQSSEDGPHLEFQIRGSGGIALDPELWLTRR
jgi:septal ring factor EnvC (AmiA/AmiB activator)